MKIINITKKALLLTLIALFTGAGALQGMNEKKEEVTTQTIENHWKDQSLTSEMVETYVRARLAFRINHWKNELKKWQETWSINSDEEIILSSLSEKCREELQKIPFYIFYTVNNDKLLEYLKNRHFRKVYIVMNEDEGNRRGFDLKKFWGAGRSAMLFNSSTILLNGSKSLPNFFYFLTTIEHELTHVEQIFEKYILTHHYKNKNFTACLMMLFFYPDERIPYKLMITKHSYALYDYLQNFYHKLLSLSASELENQNKKIEGEADNRSIQFVESLSAYNYYKEFYLEKDVACLVDYKEYYSEEGYHEGGYYTIKKTIQLLRERLISEGYLKGTSHVYNEKLIPQKLVSLQPLPLLYNVIHIDEMGGTNFMPLRSRL